MKATKQLYLLQRLSRKPTTSPLHISHHLLLLLLLLGFSGSSYAFCPSKCQCLGGDANSRAYCVDAALEDLPIQLNPETRYINLTLNKIRNLEFTLPFYMKLEVLDLSQNIIETLGSKNFEYQSEMRTLNLSRNSVSSLQKDAFKGLQNLLLLDLSYNRIEVVHPNAMLDLASLVEFDLTNNNIVSLEDNCFRGMISLEILIFKNNQLLDVPANNLLHLHSLKSLDLSMNLIEYVRNDSFEGLKELWALTMRGNVISELDASSFEGLNALKQMDLGDNNLTMVPTQQLSKLSNLTYLSLSGNRFVHLPPVAFMNLFHLRELHLSRLDHLMRIDSRAFVDNTHLQSLHLNMNPMLSDVPMRLFQGNPNILEVFMQSNNLHTLDAAQFPVDQLERLHLGDNPLQCNCSLLWLWRLVTGHFDNGRGSAAPANRHNLRPSMASGGDSASTDINDSDVGGDGSGGGGGTVAALGVSRETAASMAAYVADRPPTPSESNSAPIAASSFESSRSLLSGSSSSSSTGYLKLDIDRIGCDVWQDSIRTRRHLAAMSESEITCPAHIVTIVCAILTCLVVLMTGASIVFYLRFVKRRRKLLHDRSLRTGKSIVNVHDRILQHQPLSGGGSGSGLGGIGGSSGMLTSGQGMFGSGLGGGGSGMGGGLSGVPIHNYHGHHTLQPQGGSHHAMHPLHHHDYHQTLPQPDKLEMERYLAAQAIANEYRALKPWELPVKEVDTYSDEPEHLYEKFDHYEYPDTQTLAKLKLQQQHKQQQQQQQQQQNDSLLNLATTGGNGGNGGNGVAKPHVVYV